MVKAADTWDFESNNHFKFKVLEHEYDKEYQNTTSGIQRAL